MKTKSARIHITYSSGEKNPPNELRIDAAEGDNVKGKRQSAAASVPVELSRVWKMKPGTAGEKIL